MPASDTPTQRVVAARSREGDCRMIAVRGIDHIVLPVADVDRALAFYHGVLGLPVEREAEFRAGQVSFPSVRVDDRFIIDLFPRADEQAAPARHNLDHFCLVVETENMAALVTELEGHAVPILRPPAPRWGAQGIGTSLYVADPDGNRLEIRCYRASVPASAPHPATARNG
jgi:catechol 2,3-dioxygenase-like lactoylglutathione lyase family enzyme